MNKKILMTILLIIALFHPQVGELLAAPVIGTVQQVRVNSVSLNRSNLSLTTGQSVTLTAAIEPFNASNKNISWTSSNTAVIQVNPTSASDATVRAVGTGNAIVTVTTEDGNRTATCSITVSAPFIAVRTVSLDQEEVYIVAGEELILNARVVPDDATDQGVTWQSTDPGVVSVIAVDPARTTARNPQGRVIGHKEGEARIIVRSMQDDNINAFCTIIVSSDSPSTAEPTSASDTVAGGETSTQTTTVPQVPTEDYSAPASSVSTIPYYIFGGIGIAAVALLVVFLVVRGGSKVVKAPEVTIKAISGYFTGKTIKFEDDRLLIGRDDVAAQLIYPQSETKISRHHCKINYDRASDSYTITDLSTNGTFLANGERFISGKPYSLNKGDRFYLADAKELFEL